MSRPILFPPSPTAGQTFSQNGLTFFYDGDDWKSVTQSTDFTPAALGLGPMAGYRNVMINGGFEWWQRGTSFSNPASGAYVADRWRVDWNGTGATRTISRLRHAVGTEIEDNRFFLRWAQTVAGTGGDFNVLQQRVEGVRTLHSGPVTISYFARAATAMTVPEVRFIQDYGTGGTPNARNVISAATNVSIGTTWTRYSHTINVPAAAGVTGTNLDSYVALQFALPTNATFTIDIATVQVERGTTATSFERRTPSAEYLLGARYTVTMTHHIQNPVTGAFLLSAYNFPVPMRVTPTVALLAAGLTLNAGTTSFLGVTPAPWGDGYPISNRGGYFQIVSSDVNGYWIDRQYLYAAEL